MTRRARGCIKAIAIAAGILFLAIVGLLYWLSRDIPLRYPDYSLDLDLEGEGPYLAGAAKRKITPPVPWEGGEPVWLAGYHAGRSATGVHDDLWARAVVLRAGEATVAIAVLDLIGLFHQEVIAIRKAIDPALGIDYVVVASTHTHSGPDTIGLWGSSHLRTGFREEYVAKIRKAVVAAITEAASRLEPSRLVFARRDLQPDGILGDSRKPIVMDPELSILEARPLDRDGAIGSIVNWSCHPEVLDDKNRLITSDFPHALREAIEAGSGGVCLFLAGSIGGLQTPLEVPMEDEDGNPVPEASFEKMQALGERLGSEALAALGGEETLMLTRGTLRARARTFLVPLQNRAFHLASKIGVIRRGSAEGRKVRTEVGLVEIGPVPILLIPGEIYPEIVVGGIESPPGADFELTPQEVPPLKEEMKARIRFVIGLANDQIGYLIPKSEWDVDPPFLYGADRSPYGEINSVGPDAAGLVHDQALRLIRESVGRRQ